jgi:hypothetical protein
MVGLSFVRRAGTIRRLDQELTRLDAQHGDIILDWRRSSRDVGQVSAR